MMTSPTDESLMAWIMCALILFFRLIILCTSDLRQRSGQEQLCVSFMGGGKWEVVGGRVIDGE